MRAAAILIGHGRWAAADPTPTQIARTNFAGDLPLAIASGEGEPCIQHLLLFPDEMMQEETVTTEKVRVLRLGRARKAMTVARNDTIMVGVERAGPAAFG